MEQKEMQAALECYNPEANLFPSLARQALTPRHVLLILRWKLGRIKTSAYAQTVSEENMRRINHAISAAPKDKVAALKELASVPGIGLATASAILTVVWPDDFTIIDWRALETLGYPENRQDTDKWTAETYVADYLPHVQAKAKEWGRSLRDTDRILWGLSVNKNVEGVLDT